MYKKVYVNDSDIKFNYLIEPLRSNKMPRPFKKITIEEYFNQLSLWHFEYEDFFQLFGDEARLITEEDGLAKVFCSFNDDCGYARVVNTYTNKTSFFRIGCIHNYKIISEEPLTNTYKCSKCGNIITMSNGK